MRVMKIFVCLLTIFVSLVSVNAKSTIMDKFNSGGAPQLRKMKKTNLASMYQSSSHARALQAQKNAYRKSAQANQRTFGGSSPQKSKKFTIPPYLIYNKTL